MKNYRRITLWMSGLMLFCGLFFLPFSLATPPQTSDKVTPTNSNKRTWNLKNVDLQTVINELAKETGKNFVVSPQVTGKVTFISSYPLSTDEVYQAFLALLKTSGFVAIENDAIVKIVPETFAKEEGSPIYNQEKRSHSEEMAVTIARVKYVSAIELVKVLKQLVYHFGYIEAYSPTNDIIISDYSSNIARLLTLIRSLDKATASSIEVIHLKYAQSNDLVKMVSSLGQKSGSVNNLMLAADERSNNVLIQGGTPEQHLQIRSLIYQLDVPVTTKSVATEVIYLKYLRAEKVAVILSSLIENYKREKNNLSPADSAETMAAASSSTQSDQPEKSALVNYANSLRQTPTSQDGQNMGGNNNPAVDFSNMAQKQSKSGSASRSVQWEESTNTVIISAPSELLAKLKKVIKKLDIRRPQVLIEAVIAEVEANRANELGIELNTGGRVQLLTRFMSTLPLSGIGNNNDIGVSNPAALNSTGQGLSGTFYRGNTLRVLLRALEQDSRSNILSTPNIVTLDNEPAQIKVGQKISFSIGQIQNNPTGGNPFNYYNQQDVGLILTINPQITSDGSIKLIIEQELSNVLPGQFSAGSNPNLSERFIHTTVMANDGDLLVLGGLIQNQWQDTTSKVPLLGDIPGIGILFKSHNRQLTKQNLMVFLRPTILYEEKNVAKIVGNKYEKLRQQQLKVTEENLREPVLPAQGVKEDLPPPFAA
jgi:general secretion pathway protein D